MTAIERGPLIRYQIVWKSGHIEEIEAHQVMYPDTFRHYDDSGAPRRDRVRFHGEFDGQWQLVLEADLNNIESIRNLSVCGDGLS